MRRIPLKPFPYIRGQPTEKTPPLGRIQPRAPSKIISTWLERSPPPRGWVLAPLGNVPHLSVEAARSGHRVVVAANNPIARFLLRQHAQPPQHADFQSALATLASTFKGKERLEPHILSLYATECPHCGKTIPAQAFLWKRESPTPHAKLCRCSHCGNSGEYPTTPADTQKAAQYQNNPLYQARALTRVAPPGDPIRSHAEDALTVYTARAVYALFTIINQFSGMALAPPKDSHLAALILNACYRAASLWEHPPNPNPFTHLALPEQYRENNVWFALEEGVEAWAAGGDSVPLVPWPEPPPEGGVSVFGGPIRDLAPQLDEKIGAVLMAFPQPNQAYWTFSALWSGWLWGQKAAAPLRNIMRLPSFDNAWYARALHSALSRLTPHLKPATPCLGLTHGDKDFLSAVTLAAHSAGLSLGGLALDSAGDSAQLLWHPRPKPAPTTSPKDITSILRASGYGQLREMGEPAPTLTLHAAGLAALDAEGAFPGGESPPSATTYQNLTKSLEDTFAYRQGFLRYPEEDRWWHKELSLSPLTLADRVEMTLIKSLAEEGSSRSDLEAELYAAFPGLLTPDAKLIQVCLDSYGQEESPDSENWVLKPGDAPTARREDLKEMAALLQNLGRRLNYTPHQAAPLGNVRVFTWNDGGETAYTFFISASAILSKIVLKSPQPPPNPWIILPGGRANLVAHKRHYHPPLDNLLDENWGFMKFRHLRGLANDLSLTRDTVAERFEQDPLTYDEPQLVLGMGR